MEIPIEDIKLINTEHNTELDSDDLVFTNKMSLEFIEYITHMNVSFTEFYKKYKSGDNSPDIVDTMKNLLNKTNLISEEKFKDPKSVMLYMLVSFLERSVGTRYSPLVYKLQDYINMCTNDEINKKIIKFDEETWKVFLEFYMSTYQMNKEEHNIEIYEMCCKFNPLYDETTTKYPINLIDTIIVYITILTKYIDKMLLLSYDSFIVYIDKTSEHETEKVQKLFDYVIDKVGVNNTEIEDTIIRDHIQSYCIKNKQLDILKKYELIIIFAIREGKFVSDNFKKTIKERLYNLQWDNYDVSKKYLLSNIKLDSQYQIKRDRIISGINLYKNVMDKQEKLSKEQNELIQKSYEERRNMRLKI